MRVLRSLGILKHNYKLKLEYNGERFNGSQIQNSKNTNSDKEIRTVQDELEKALKIYFKDYQISKTNFSSRTDAGVHAIGQVVNFKTDKAIPNVDSNPDKLLISLNGILASDIVLTKIEEVPLEFHARFDAQSREYLYKIFIRKHRPVLRLDSLAWEKSELDFDAMQKHAQSLLGTHDFRAYCKVQDGDEKNNYECEILESQLIKENSICFKYKIKSNRFLRHMVRNIVAELIEVGKGNPVPEDKSKIAMAPANGLVLTKVNYDLNHKNLQKQSSLDACLSHT